MSKCKVYCYCSMNIDLDEDIIINSLLENDFLVLIDKTIEKIQEKLEDSEIEYANLSAIYRKGVLLWEE